jgi:hypothetical protein
MARGQTANLEWNIEAIKEQLVGAQEWLALNDTTLAAGGVVRYLDLSGFRH